MSIEKQRMIETIEELPEELTEKIIDYIEYVKFEYIINKAPNNLVIKDTDDLIKKVKEGIEDTDNGKVCSLDQAFEEVQEILNN